MDAEDLYGLPLDQFVDQRGALAKALRADGKRDEANDISALHKPSVAAWAVNQLVRTQAKAFERLLSAGEELVGVQAGVLAGDREPTELREAVASQREAVDRLLEAAGGLLSSEGHELSPAALDRVADTLQAAALDPEAREQVQGGRLERELRHVGLGAGGLAPAGSPAKAKTKSRRAGAKSAKSAKPAGAKQASRADRVQPAKSAEPADTAASRADAKRAERERQEARRTARHAEADARRAAERAHRALEVAQERHDKAAEALATADRAVAEAERTAERTADAHQEAQQALEAL